MSFRLIENLDSKFKERFNVGIEEIIVDEAIFNGLLRDSAELRKYDIAFEEKFFESTNIRYKDIVITKSKNSEINRVTAQIKELQEKLDKLKSNNV